MNYIIICRCTPVHAWSTASTFLIILFCPATVIEISFPEFSSTEKKEDGDILLKVFQKVQSPILPNKYLRILRKGNVITDERLMLLRDRGDVVSPKVFNLNL